MRAKLVRFASGKFGIRYGWFYFRFQDFQNTGFKWRINSSYIRDCMTDEETARVWLRAHPYEVIS